MKKSEIDTRWNHGTTRPTVNVKIRSFGWAKLLPLHLGSSRMPEETAFTEHYTDAGFTEEWVEKHIGEGDDYRSWYAYEQMACEQGWEYLQDEAEMIWPEYSVKVYSEGRSGGWAVVHGLPELEGWDALMVNRWARFARSARATADDIPRAVLDLVYSNVYEPALDQRDQAEAELDVPDYRRAVRAVALLADAEAELSAEDDDEDWHGSPDQQAARCEPLPGHSVGCRLSLHTPTGSRAR